MRHDRVIALGILLGLALLGVDMFLETKRDIERNERAKEATAAFQSVASAVENFSLRKKKGRDNVSWTPLVRRWKYGSSPASGLYIAGSRR